MPETISPAAPLRGSLHGLAETLEQIAFRLPSPERPRRRSQRDELVWSIREYLLPRLADLEGPVVAVVLGSTGSGKSTLVNSLARAPISDVGPLRPTTRTPVVWTHRRHGNRYREEFLTGYGPESSKPLRVVEADDPMLEDLTVLDAPDFDSVVAENREMADELLSVADLCVFMTTAQRYADAVPWEFLRRARRRGLPILYVVNRLPTGSRDHREILVDYARQLADQDLILEPNPEVLFTIPEQEVDPEDGRLPPGAVEAIRRELSLLADPGLRHQLIRQATEGAVADLVYRGRRVAEFVEAERAEAEALVELARVPYRHQAAEVARLLRDGTLIRGEVLARWQEFVGTGDLVKALAEGAGRVQAWLRRVLGGSEPPGSGGSDPAGELVAAVVRRADLAAREAAAAWERDPIGKALLSDPEPPLRFAQRGGLGGHGGPGAEEGAGAASSGRTPPEERSADNREELWRHDPELLRVVRRDLREWVGEVRELVAELGEGKRRGARAASLGVNAAAVAVLLGVFAQTGGLTGAELGVAAGAAAAQQKLLEHLFGSAAARSLIEEARGRLEERLEAALERDAARFERLALDHTAPPDLADRLRERVNEVSRRAGELYRG